MLTHILFEYLLLIQLFWGIFVGVDVLLITFFFKLLRESKSMRSPLWVQSPRDLAWVGLKLGASNISLLSPMHSGNQLLEPLPLGVYLSMKLDLGDGC